MKFCHKNISRAFFVGLNMVEISHVFVFVVYTEYYYVRWANVRNVPHAVMNCVVEYGKSCDHYRVYICEFV